MRQLPIVIVLIVLLSLMVVICIDGLIRHGGALRAVVLAVACVALIVNATLFIKLLFDMRK